MTRLVLPSVAAFLATVLFTPLVRGVARRIGMVARPSKDRWHDQPTAMLGGVAVFAGFAIGVVVILSLFTPVGGPVLGRSGLAVLVAGALMFVVGLVDDSLNVRPATKLIFQAVAAAVVISAGVVYPATAWTTVNVLLTFIWFLMLTNALNLLDNMDGVAVGVSGIAASFLAITFANEGSWILAMLGAALAGASFGFLPYNFSRASIFMGDSGSLFLGATLAAMGAAYPATAPASIVSVLFVPALIVIVPIVDTLLVSVARTLAGRPISVGGRDHAAHRLVAMGLSEAQVALLLYSFAACGGILALVLRRTDLQFGLVLGATFLVGLLILAAYLSRIHTYAPTEQPSPRVTVMLTDLLHKRRALETLLDMVLFAVAYQCAYLLRWEGELPPAQLALFQKTIALAIACKLAAFGLMGAYRGSWHHLGLSDAFRLGKASLIGSVFAVTLTVFLYKEDVFSRSVFVIDGLLTILLVTGARASFRLLDHLRSAVAQTGSPTLVYGAGEAGELTVRQVRANASLGLKLVGFIDDDPAKDRLLLGGLPVLGGFDHLESALVRYGIRTVVCSPSVVGERFSLLRQRCQELNVSLCRLRIDFVTIVGSGPRRPTEEAGLGVASERPPALTAAERSG
jgi:UDP-GlcNAc:undecaprenyl-phosphate GlcNAc-1-phosphate transferase